MVMQGSGKETKKKAEREVAKLMPLSDPLTPITTFRSDYGLRKQVCLFSCLSRHSCLSPPPPS